MFRRLEVSGKLPKINFFNFSFSRSSRDLRSSPAAQHSPKNWHVPVLVLLKAMDIGFDLFIRGGGGVE